LKTDAPIIPAIRVFFTTSVLSPKTIHTLTKKTELKFHMAPLARTCSPCHIKPKIITRCCNYPCY